MKAEIPPVETPVTVEDVRASLQSPKVRDPFRETVEGDLDRGYDIDRAEMSCLAGLTSDTVDKLPGEVQREYHLARLHIVYDQIPSLVANDDIEYLTV